MLRAGLALGRDDLIACGLDTLDWIIARQTSPDGRFRAIGTESFGREYAEPMPFDQQPLEAQATIDACAVAYAATSDTRWIDGAMRRADERRVGRGCVSTVRYRWSAWHEKKNKKKKR